MALSRRLQSFITHSDSYKLFLINRPINNPVYSRTMSSQQDKQQEGGMLDSLKEGAQNVGQKIQEGFETAKSKIVGEDREPTTKEFLAGKVDSGADSAKEKVRDITGKEEPTTAQKIGEKVEHGLDSAREKVKETTGRRDPTLTEKFGDKVESGLDSIQQKAQEYKKD